MRDIPLTQKELGMDESSGDRITIRCSCGAKLKMPAKAAGKRARCPKCKEVFTIPKPEPEPVAAGSGAPLDDDDPEALFDDLLKHAAAAPAVETTPEGGGSGRCSQCGAEMPASACVCVSCGFNTGTGKALKAATVKKASKLGGAATLAGTFMLGCLLSGVGALLGAVVWVVIAIASGYELGIIAWGVGVVAGVGMTIGYRNHSAVAGLVAMGMAVIGLLVAKVGIFVFVIYAVITGNTNNIELQRAFVTAMVTEEILDDRGVFSDADRDEEWESAWDEAAGQVDAMNDDEVRIAWQEYRDLIESGEVEDVGTVVDEGGPPTDGAVGDGRSATLGEGAEDESADGWLGGFLATSFGIFDVLWFILAMGSAFKIASGGTEA